MDVKKIKEENREISLGEQRVEFSEQESEERKKSEEILEREKIVMDQTRREIEAMKLDKSLEEEARKDLEKMKFLAQEEKIGRLLEVADEKGVIFAVKVAKDINDPFILDTFHDILAKKGYYKKFTK
ncbi:MAG: hypothetical protein HYT36_03655 [Candidatus Staskawiczbacteria bacterium]|nr:hypothetical protein [Candidatus Staskawiczbacteria bacterium]